MTRLWFITIALVVLALVFTGPGSALLYGEARGDEGEGQCTIMHPSHETLLGWVEACDGAPEVSVSESGFQLPAPGSTNLIDHLEYTPSERDQGSCGNCWAWAGTGIMEIALDVQEKVKNRLSIQYLNSNFGTGDNFACCGGWLSDLADFYTGTGKAIPWSNTNAHWQDGSQSCPGSTIVPAASIDTTPYYDIIPISNEEIYTQGVGEGAAIANIQAVLDQDRGVWFAFFLPTGDDWDNFRDFWNNDSGSDIWNPNYSCGHTWSTGSGGHAVLCVGYDYSDDENDTNDYWIMLNSWGTTADRPDGLFRLDMHMNYDCYYYDPVGPPPGNYYSFYWQTLDIDYTMPGEAINIVGKTDNNPVSQIVFPAANPGAIVSAPYNDYDGSGDPQVLAASNSSPVVKLYNASSGDLLVRLGITNWGNGVVVSEDYELVAEDITDVSVVDDVLSSTGSANTVDTNVTIYSGDWLDLYLEVALCDYYGVSGDSTLTILGEFP